MDNAKDIATSMIENQRLLENITALKNAVSTDWFKDLIYEKFIRDFKDENLRKSLTDKNHLMYAYAPVIFEAYLSNILSQEEVVKQNIANARAYFQEQNNGV